jgi:aminopeptidase N
MRSGRSLAAGLTSLGREFLVLGLVLALTALAAVGCGSGSRHSQPPPRAEGKADDTGTSAYDAALSEPREDSVYPAVGDPGVDALHYSLDLTWDDKTATLTATETLLFRATTSADHVQLDLARQLLVRRVWLDGKVVPFEHVAKDLVVSAPVTADSRHVLQLSYGGTPEPVRAPTDRPDFSTTGWTIARDGTVWTMQEPYGAYSWYAVNDQPSDKAFYDFTIHAPAGQVGVANGQLVSRRTVGGLTTTRWHLPEPAASYLVTIAIGRFTRTRDTGPHGLPISYWTPRSRPAILRQVRYAPDAVAYLEGLVGRYPFPTLGILVVPSLSAMETQSMVTLGTTGYTLSRDVIVHEIAHQWYGDTVTCADWSDLWMNEGMATYLAEVNWSADHGPDSREEILRSFAHRASWIRDMWGPPTAYHPESFGEGDVYFIPALMWDTLRQRLGDDEFWSLATRWLQAHRFTSQDRAALAAWWSRESGQDLTPVFDAWLVGEREPAWRAG